MFFLLMSNGVTLYLGLQIGRWTNRRVEPVDVAALEEQVIDESEMALFFEVLDIIKSNYVDDIDMEELEQGAIQGMLEILDDPQTNFFTKESMEEMMQKTMGSYSGIGIVIDSQDDYITVVSPIKGTPGEKAGLMAGDRILQVDGKDIKGITSSEAANLMRGPEGEPVTIVIERDGVGELEFTIIRKSIDLETVFPEMLEEGIGYMYVSNFDSSTGREFEEGLADLESQGLQGLILDLRDNPGGLLSEAIRVGQAVVPEGAITHVVDGEGATLKTHYSQLQKKPYPIVVLVNEYSASASEIVAGALQDSHGALLVGTRTYGKATVQNLEDLTEGGIRYTIAKYLTPQGRSIDGLGLEPDYEVSLPPLYLTTYHPLDGEPRPGDSGDEVLFLKQFLEALNYPTKEGAFFDEVTESSLRSFQEQEGLKSTGYLDKDTKERLTEALEARLAQADAQLEKALSIIKEKI